MKEELGAAKYFAEDERTKNVDELKHEGAVVGNGEAGVSAGELCYPLRLAVDRQDNIIVADSGNHRVQGFSSEGKLVLSFGRRGSGDVEFHCPVSVAIDKDNNIYVVDQSNHRVQVFSHEGELVRKFGSSGSEAGQLQFPEGIAVSEIDGLVYVSDYYNSRLQVFSSTGEHVSFIGVGVLHNPTGVALDEEDNIYITDYNQQ